MLEGIMWVLLVIVVAYSIWFNYHHFTKLLDGTITLKQELIAVGSIVLAVILFIMAVIVRVL